MYRTRQSSLLSSLCGSTALRSPRYVLLSSLSMALISTAALAGPQDGQVAGGAASITSAGSTTTINQSSNRAIIDWRSFDVGSSELVQFNQPSDAAVTLNRVQAGSPSQIDGQIKANGNVIIVNPNGVFFGSNSRVDVNSLVVTSADIENNEFMAGRDNFNIAGSADAKIVNQGKITAKDAGLVGLVAPQVENSGIITARLGKVQAASGDRFTLDLYGDGLISVAATGDLQKQLVQNSGSISADGGQIVLSAAEARSNIDNMIVNTGHLQTNSVGVKNGEIILSSAKGSVQNTGTIHAKGSATQPGGKISVHAPFTALGGEINADGSTGGTITVNAHTLSLADSISAKGLSGKGGDISLESATTWETSTSRLNADGMTLGGNIRHMGGAQIISSGQYSAQGITGLGGTIDISAASTKFLSAKLDTSGLTGGGTIRLGGEYQGGNNLPTDEIPNANYLVMDRGTEIRSRATGSAGKGGTAILWSDLETLALGTIDTTPGTISGDGGFVEVSSAGTLQYDATVTTGRGARAGQVLLDPKNIVISDFALNATAIIMGYGYSGGNNIQTNLDVSDIFGYSVSLDGTRLAIGAPYDDGFGNSRSNSGAVYLYNFADTNFNGGTLEAIMGVGYTGGKNLDLSTSLDANDQFGYSVSLDGKRLAVSANTDDGASNALPDSGAVYLINFSDLSFSTPTLMTKIGYGFANNNSFLGTSDSFGSGLSLNGNRLAVGAMLDDGNANTKADSGAVYLYSFDDDNFTNLTLQSRIGWGYTGGKNFNVTNLDTIDYFGNNVALDGNMLAVGARLDDGFGNSVTDAGAVYLFTFADATFSTPTLQGIIGNGYTGGKNVNLSQLDASDRFGQGVALDNQRLAVGAIQDDGYSSTGTDTGAVYLFTMSDMLFSSVTLQGMVGYNYSGNKNIDLAGRGIGTSDNFGSSISLDGHNMVVGAHNDDGYLNATADSGAVYMFSFTDAAFSGGKLEGMIGAGYTEGKNVNVTSLSDTDGGSIGTAVSIDGRKLAIGDILNDGFNSIRMNSGAVYLYSFTDDSFGGGVLQAIIGDGYVGGKNYSQALRPADYFGSGVSLDGNRLAVGAYADDGAAATFQNGGAVYLYQFDDATFSNISLTSRIGASYTGPKDINAISFLNFSDYFGYSVSLDGNRLAVGAYADDGAGNLLTDSGAVYLFTFTDLNFSGGQLAATIGRGYTGSKNIDVVNLDASDYFGYSVSLDGNRLAVGAYADDGSGNLVADAGAVYLFTFTDAAFSGGSLQSIIGSGYSGGKNVNQALDTLDYFGNAVALTGNTLFVGARGDDGAANVLTNPGAVYRYSFTNSAFAGGSLASTIGVRYTGANDIDLRGYLGSSDTFGRSLSVDGLNLVIGSPSDDGYQNGALDIGAVYLMHFTDLTYQTGSIEGIIGQDYGQSGLQKSIGLRQVKDGDYFGGSVSLDGNRLAVGAYGDDGFNDAVTDSGAVYLFSFTDSNFSGGVLEGIIGSGYTGGKNINLSAYLETTDFFGRSVSLDGNMLAVGALQDDGAANARTNSGAVYLFNFTDSVFSGGTLQAIAGYNYTGGKNINVAVEANDLFGMSVSLDANRLAVGARGDDGSANGRTDSGAVYLYSFSDSAFSGGTLRNMIGYNYGINLALDTSDQFGSGVSLDGDRLAVSAWSDDGASNGLTDSGAVYLYTFSTPATFAGATLQGRIGQGYTGGKNVNIAAQLDTSDQFGSSISLDGTRLAVGALGNDGYNNMAVNSGGAYLFTFSDLAFSGGSLAGQIGYRYTGAKDINLETPLLSSVNDQGGSVSLDGQRLIYGSYLDDYNISDSGTVTLINFTDNAFSGGAIQGIIGNGFSRGLEISPELRTLGDIYGTSVSLKDNRIAIGVIGDDGFNNIRTDTGAVYLYTATGGNFSQLVLEGIIGRGYTGGKNINLDYLLDVYDQFGSAVSLSGNRLAVGAFGDDGADNNCGNCGAVYLFNFSDAAFNGGTLTSRIGYNYSGGKNLSLTGMIASTDYFGWSLSLDGNRLAVGAALDDGNANVLTDSGAVYLFSFADDSFTTPILQSRIGYGYTSGKNMDTSTLDASDNFGYSVALDGRRLAIGSIYDDGKLNDRTNAGAVYLYTFSDDVFSGITSAGIMGYGYNAAKDYNMSSLYLSDYFGSAVSLQNTILAVGAYGDDGMNLDNINGDVSVSALGAVHLFTFSDLNMNGKTYDSSIGVGYTGGKNISVPTLVSGSTQYFGRAVSMDDGTLLVGAPQNRGTANTSSSSGAAYLFRSSLLSPSNGFNYANLGSSTIGITAASLAQLLSTPQNVTLQASNDITFASALLVDNVSGNGGNLTLQAGRSIIINSPIDTDNGNIYLYGNEKLSTGVVNSQRDSGPAVITMGAGSSINAGTGSVVIRLDDGAGKTNATVGNITLRDITAYTILGTSALQTGNIVLNGVLTASGSGTPLVLAAGASFINNAGAGALVTTDPSARWLVYSDHPSLNTLGGLTSDFSIYRCNYNGTCSTAIPGSGKGLLYQYGPVIVQIAVDTTRAYGDANPSGTQLQSLYTYTGLQNGDTAAVLDVLPTVSVTGLTATSVTGSVGTLVLTGGSDDVYDYYLVGGSITVVKKDITAAWNAPLTKIYGDVNPTANTANFTYSGLANGETGSVITASADMSAITTATAVGSYSVGSTFTATNYNVINPPTTLLTITKRDITAAWISSLSRIYGDANPSVSTANFNYSGLVNGDTGAVITANGTFGTTTATTNVGTYSVSSAFSATNYNVTNTPTTTLTINKRDITAIVDNQSRVYGNANPSLTWNNVSFANLANGETGSVLDTVALTMPTALLTSNAGTSHAINLSVTDNNYNLTGYTAGTLAITKRDVTAAWNAPLSKTYG
ncbi:MAG TPA: hypothetical protein DCM27_04535, partial [Rhodospirillaceae bacterium]|nr:hypothetical protein [Rhodospirillaceae bacterium]